MNYIEQEQKRAEREMYQALNPKKNKETSLAPSTNTGYNVTKDTNSYGSYKGSSVNFNTGSNYLKKPKTEDSILAKSPGVGETYREKSTEPYIPFANSKTSNTNTSPMYQKQESNLPKIETATAPKVTMENYRVETSNINAPLPRSDPNESFNNWIKENFGETKTPLQSSNAGENYGFTPENAETRTSPLYQKQAPTLKLDLPTVLQRIFAKGALGDERETEVYNAGVLEEAAKKGYLKDTRTDDDFFKIGFLGLEDTPKYAFTEKADDNVKTQLFNLLDYKTPESRLNAFKEIQERSKFNRARKANNELRTDTLPKAEETSQQGFINPAGTTADEHLLNTSKPASEITRNREAKNVVKSIGEHTSSKKPNITQHSVFQKNNSGIKPFTKDFNNNIFTSWRKRYIEKCNGIDGVFNTDYYYAEKDGKRYRANSEETVRLYDWTSIDETFLDETFEKLINEANQKPTGMYRILSQSVDGDLDFKLKLDKNKLYLANGVLYNKNEAGNFIWAYFLESKKVSGYLSGALAQAGSKLPPLAKMDGGSRWDEEWDVKARWAGVKYYYEKNNLMWLYEELYGDSPKI